MRASFATAVILALAALVLAACASEEAADDPGEFFLPIGDAAAGRETFVELRCHYCHLVPGDDDMPGLVGEARGPDIGSRQATRSRDWVAMSIVAPGHEMPPLMRSPQSPMGDYKNLMTIRQLMDLVAFVQRAE